MELSEQMKIVMALGGMISFTVIANLLLKTGAVAGTPGQGLFLHLINWHVFFALCSFGLSVCFYLLVMQWLPLNVATSFAGAQYVAVVIAARLILAEPIGLAQWVGITLIAFGIGIVGWSQR